MRHSWLLVAAMLVSACGSHRIAAALPDAPKASGESRPAKAVPVPVMAMTLESQDQRLAAALLAVDIAPGAETYRQLGHEYRRVGILDKAHENFSNAVKLDPTDATSHDALARIWRDWGTAPLGLGDAYRAV